MGDSWLAAYESQKAAALKKIEAVKNGWPISSNGKSNSVTGASSYSGLINGKSSIHSCRSTQITRLMDSLKNERNSEMHKSKSTAGNQSPSRTVPLSRHRNGGTCIEINKSSSGHLLNERDVATSPGCGRATTQLHHDVRYRHGQKSPNKTEVRVRCDERPFSETDALPSISSNPPKEPTKALPAELVKAEPPVDCTLPTRINERRNDALACSYGSETVGGSKKATKRGSKAPSFSDMMKRARQDCVKSSQDWQTQYEERKKKAIEAMKRRDEILIGGMSAHHKGTFAPLASELSGSSNPKGHSVGHWENPNKGSSGASGAKPPPPPCQLLRSYRVGSGCSR